MWKLKIVALLMGAVVSFASVARERSLSFEHKDWMLSCDNTATCYAGGYSETNAERPVSVLFTRQAGAQQPVMGQVNLEGFFNGEDEDAAKNTSAGAPIVMFVDGKRMGEMAFVSKDEGTIANLNAAQTTALLKAFVGTGQVEWRQGAKHASMSGDGASAVLLKMDAYQKRLNTVGALVKKGTKDEQDVLATQPLPVVKKPPVGAELSEAEQAQLNVQYGAALRKVLPSTLSVKPNDEGDGCLGFGEAEGDEAESTLSFSRLSKNKLLVSALCWRAAYNAGIGFWVVNDDLKNLQPVFVTGSGTDYSDGEISAVHKARGIGDCFVFDEWVWDGAQFVHTEERTTGMCRGFAGGAWDFYTLRMKVLGKYKVEH